MNTDFSLPNNKDEIFNSSEHLPLIVYFYPKDNTPGCTIEAIDFSQLKSEFTNIGYTIVGISRDTSTSHQKFIDKQNLSIELLSDVDEVVCKQFDVIKEKNMYGKKVLGIERSTFILDKTGKIIKEFRKVSAKNHAAEVLNYLTTLTI